MKKKREGEKTGRQMETRKVGGSGRRRESEREGGWEVAGEGK